MAAKERSPHIENGFKHEHDSAHPTSRSHFLVIGELPYATHDDVLIWYVAIIIAQASKKSSGLVTQIWLKCFMLHLSVRKMKKSKLLLVTI